MNIVQITPGAGAMYCGNCFRDNTLVRELRQLGHSALMVPVYLPLTLDEDDQSRGTPLFFNGVNVYFDQKSRWFRNAPKWVHRLTASPALLKLAASRAAKTRASDVGDITLSMALGEQGNQARELDQLIAFLKTQSRPDVVCLSNVLLAGMARKLKSELGCAVACVLQGEDSFLDALSDTYREPVWKALAERCRDIDLFIPPTRYFGELMGRRLKLAPERVRVIYNGIALEGYPAAEHSPVFSEPPAPTLGYFARMCREKGLDTLVEAFIHLKERGRVKNLKLKVGGGCGPSDEPFVAALRSRIESKSFLADAEFHPNLDHRAKQAFLRSLSVFSVPALYGEAFGLYVIEAFASGVPVVQPRHAGFPELVNVSGGGIICEAGNPKALGVAIEEILLNQPRARALGEAGRAAVRERFNARQMAVETVRAFESITRSAASAPKTAEPQRA
jgi:glycosyltransferase involved in cell wall biosynthesis